MKPLSLRIWACLGLVALISGGNSAYSDDVSNPSRSKDNDLQYQMGLDSAKYYQAYNLYRMGLLTGICQVHHKKLFQETVPLNYGRPLYAAPAPGEPSDVYRFTHFPHAMQYELAGHITRHPKTVDIYVCPDCLKAQYAWERKWYADHPPAVDPKIRDQQNEENGNHSALF